jgi:hypothetical protein
MPHFLRREKAAVHMAASLPSPHGASSSRSPTHDAAGVIAGSVSVGGPAHAHEGAATMTLPEKKEVRLAA